MSVSTYHILLEKLDRFIRKYYINQLIRGSIFFFSLLVLTTIAVTLAEYFGHFGLLMRGIIFFGYVGLMLTLLIKWVVMPLSKYYRLGSVITHQEASDIIGNHFHEVRDKLLNVLMLKEMGGSINQADNSLIEHAISQKIDQLQPIPFTLAIDFRRNIKYLKYAIVPFAIILVIGFSTPEVLVDGSDRLINYSTAYEEELPFHLNLVNEDLSGLKNEDFEILMSITGDEVPAQVYVEMNNNSFRLKKRQDGMYSYTIRNLQKNERFRFHAQEYYSPTHEVKAYPKPALLGFSIDVVYPAYLNRGDVTQENKGNITIPEGSKVSWKFNTADAETFLFDMGTRRTLQSQGGHRYTFDTTLFQSTDYSITALNQYVKSKDSLTYKVEVIKDQYPSIFMQEEIDSVTSTLYFHGEIQDDYGFASLQFHYRKNGNETFESVPVRFSPRVSEQRYYHKVSLEELGLKAGDELDYYFEVGDNDGLHGSKKSKTRMGKFRKADKSELQARRDKNSEEMEEEFEEALREAKEMGKELEEIKKKLLEDKKVSWEEKKQLEELLERHKELAKKINQVQEKNEENLRLQEETVERSEELMEKQQQLMELMEEIMTEEMKELMEELEKMMEDMNREHLQEMIEEMEVDNKDIEKELDRSLELFKQMEVQLKAEEMQQELEALAQKQEELASEEREEGESKKEADEREAKEQEELNKEFEGLEKKMEELEKKNEGLEQTLPLPNMEQEQKKAGDEMQKASDQLEQNKGNKANEHQQNAAEEMKKMAQQMSDMQASMQQQQGEDLQSLRATLENLVQVSFDQEALMQDLSGMRPNDPGYVDITRKQRALKDNTKLIEDSLFALSKRVVQIAPTINREINAINYNIDKSIQLMTSRKTDEATFRQQTAMTSMNNLALLLAEAVEQMQQQMQQQMSSGQCSKPGQSKPGQGQPKPNPSLQQLQKQLNKQMEEMKKAMKEGQKKPGQKGKPGEGKEGMNGNSEELAKMAARQAKIRSELRKMAEQLGQQEAQDLKKIEKMMDETEKDIVNRNITRETLMRQEEILTRLLESEKAEREREKEEKREAREGKNEKNSNLSELEEYYKAREREIEQLQTVSPKYSRYYKKRIEEYFEQINENQ